MKHIMIALIRFYQKHISSHKPSPTCRFSPTCSAYALTAFQTRGFFAGFVLMCWRILRCNPFSPCGYDPVPRKGFRTMPMRYSKYDREEYTARILREAQMLDNDAEKDATDTPPQTHDDGTSAP